MLRRELWCVGSTAVLRSLLNPWALLIAPLALVSTACSGGDVTAEPAPTAISTTTRPVATTSAPTTVVERGAATENGIGNGRPVTIAFGGDVHFAPPLDSTLARSPLDMLEGVRTALESADLSIVNLETAIGISGERQSKSFTFQAPPAAFEPLLSAGVDVIGMANNHALDYGQPGLTETLDAIAARSAPVIGIGVNDSAAFAPFTRTVNGQRIAVIAATQVLDGNLVAAWTATDTHAGVASAKRVDRLLGAVREARRSADTVVVFLHWGTELSHCPNAAQLELAPQLVEAGADVIVGGHAHRVQGGGYLGRAYVEYGLGNLMFYAKVGEGRETGILTVTVTGRRVDDAAWQPARIGGDFRPNLEPPAAAVAPLGRWASYRACAKLADAPSGG